MHGRYVKDILKMCMKKFNAEKLFLTNLQGFDLHLAGGYTVSLACSQFLVLIFVALVMTFGMQKDDKITFCWGCFRTR